MKMPDTAERVRKRRYEAKRLQRENANAYFVAIDSEGGSAGDPYRHEDKTFQPHKSFLWGAGNINGQVRWLYKAAPLSSEQILYWLTSIIDRDAIYISFAFGYDVGQLVADMSYQKAWELQHGKAYADKDDPDVKPNTRRVVYWKNYGLQYVKGKSLSIWRIPPGEKIKLSACRSIRIYDVFGFFQSSFLKAIRSMPGAASENEYQIVEKGKSERGNFYLSDIDAIKEYTRHELMILCRMMERLRQSLNGEDLHLTTWYGAGSIAQALMKREQVRPHLGNTKAKNIEPWQDWAHHAFFGGRIELIQQGTTHENLYGYDIASAYPAAATRLPSLADGKWIFHRTIEISKLGMLSLVRLRATFLSGLPFYPLPYRMPNGSILFPRNVYGIYMRDEAIAAMEFLRRFGGSLEIEGAWEFVSNVDAKPFAFLQHMFDYRLSLAVADILQIVIKLGINSVYGKLAQSVGQFARSPALASPVHAAAITAWTRARLLMVAMRKPEAIVMLATDGIVSTADLSLDCPKQKTLGEWEAAILPSGGIYIQSGVYAHADEAGKWKAKSRGFRPSNITGDVAEYIRDAIPAEWRKGSKKFMFPYQNYMTLGSATASEETWTRIGQWATGTRTLDLQGAGVKRDVVGTVAELRSRAQKLIRTEANNNSILVCDDAGEMLLSAPSKPEWLDVDFGFRNADENEQETIAAGMT